MDDCLNVATRSACLFIFCHSILYVCFFFCYTCWYGVSLSAVPAGAVPRYRLYPLVWCLTISPACWCGASLSTIPSGVVSHYQLCLLVWCLIINITCWCVASLSTMSSGVVPYYKSCLLVRCLNISNACWCGSTLYTMPVALHLTIGHACCNRLITSQMQMEEVWLQVWCYLCRGAIISDMSLDPLPL